MANPLLEATGLPAFGAIRPEHVEPALSYTLEQNRRAIEALLDSAESSGGEFDATILPLEELGERLRRVWSPVSHLHAVANSPELRAAYNRCLPALSRYETELAQNARLLGLYQRVAESPAVDSRKGARRLLEHAIRDFRLAGVDLPDEQKKRFQGIMEELSQLQAKFEQNVLDSMAAWSYSETNADRLAGLPATVLEQAQRLAAEASQTGWLLRLDQPTYVAVMTHADDRTLRARFYEAWSTRASERAPAGPEHDNSAVLERILALRHEAAQLIGFANFADYSLATKMAGSVTEVREFLDGLAVRARPAARREFEELEGFAGEPLEAWDIAWYAERLRRERYAVSDEELRPYFPLDTVLAGLFALVGKLYGLAVEPVRDFDGWQSDVRLYRVQNERSEELGAFFVDFFARENKRSGAWMDECLVRKRANGTLQRPVAHLVCNFAAPTPTTPCLLSHEEVTTLFHEFGHTLHHLLTRVDYPSVSGINGVPWDAVELPSQFMENFAWEPEVLRFISGHFRTGDALPDVLLEKLQASRVFQAGMQIVRQLEFALFDLRLHAEYDPGQGSRLAALLDEIRAQVAVVPYPEFNRFPHAFSHIFGGGYAAGYYSYKWAEVLAADAYAAFQEHGLFDRDVADRFRECILEIGGTQDIGAAFERFRGRPPEVGPLLAQAGIETATAS